MYHDLRNSAALGTARRQPKKSGKVINTQRQCKLQVHPTGFIEMPFQTAAQTVFLSGPQAQWARGQEQLAHCNLTPVLKGAPWLEGGRGAIPKQPSVRSQAPRKAKPPALLARMIHSTHNLWCC
ncbi:hypothetical protein CVIRNUC_009627 [Coccomyxa viridis]|uniref:Uncharacterized protein n=1 Tax=Coccomyxa viridis TaxID=1274662 RepID=A0AAV1IH43_9CHLO|nr:hypothetical protein CVIRNUC_009627 [Coccomyxa viridis]